VNRCKDPIPSGFPIGNSIIEIVKTQPYKYRSSYNMIFRNIAPCSAILRMISVVSHHPIVILFKSVGVCYHLINQNLIAGNTDSISFIVSNYFFVKG
jgi:hypothetical protein